MAEISLLGGIEIASVALIVYYVFAKTRYVNIHIYEASEMGLRSQINQLRGALLPASASTAAVKFN